MTRLEAAALIDRLIGLEPALATLVGIAQALQESGNPRLQVLAMNLHRHARGEQVSLAAVKQELQQTLR